MTWKEAAGVRISVFACRHWGNPWRNLIHYSWSLPVLRFKPKPLGVQSRSVTGRTYAACTSMADISTSRASAIFLCVVYSENSGHVISVNKDPTQNRMSAVTQLVCCAAMLGPNRLLPGSDHLSVRSISALTLPNRAANYNTALCPQNAVIPFLLCIQQTADYFRIQY
jgi:hypothetical protein